MLNLKISDDIAKEVNTDIEVEFMKFRLKDSILNRMIIEIIEKGRYNDEDSFIDRYGFKLYDSEMSTGCKAALCVANNPDKLYNLKECGYNAQDLIISILKEGNIIIPDRDMTIYNYGTDKKIDVKLDDYRFTDLDRLNYYIFDERPFKPEMTEGIEYVQK